MGRWACENTGERVPTCLERMEEKNVLEKNLGLALLIMCFPFIMMIMVGIGCLFLWLLFVIVDWPLACIVWVVELLVMAIIAAVIE